MPNNIVLFGAGGHAVSCIDVIESGSNFRISGLFTNLSDPNISVLGYPILGTDDSAAKNISGIDFGLIAVGQIKSPQIRIQLFELATSIGLAMPAIFAATSYVSKHSFIGEGTIVMNAAVVNANVSVGINSIINSQALLEHDVNVGDHTHISTGVKINGSVQVGSRTFVGSGAIVRDGVSIGDDCIISAGALVMNDVPNGTIIKN